MSAEGKVFLVGAGPGDPGLITVRGKKLIESADAIVYDALASRELLPPDATETGHPELFDVGKRGGDARSVPQSDINELLVRLASGYFEAQVIYWAAPIAGAIVAALLYEFLFLRREIEPVSHGTLRPAATTEKRRP